VVDGDLPDRLPGRACLVIAVRHVTMPEGLSVLAVRDPSGGLTLFVSDGICAERQRAAVRVALRACRRSGWRGTLIPALVPTLGASLLARLARGRTWLGGITRILRAHAAVTTAATVLTVATAAVTVALVPQHGNHLASAGNGAHRSAQGSAVLGGRANHRGGGPRSRPKAHQRARPKPEPTTPVPSGSAAPSPARTHGTPTPSASPTSRAPTPTPTPTPSPTRSPGGSGGTCIWLLGLKVCL